MDKPTCKYFLHKSAFKRSSGQYLTGVHLTGPFSRIQNHKADATVCQPLHYVTPAFTGRGYINDFVHDPPAGVKAAACVDDLVVCPTNIWAP